MLIRDVVVGVDAGGRVVIVAKMGGERYTWDDARPYWTFVVKGGPGIGKMMVIGVLICG